MSKTVKYDVLREHEGDKFYREGESREMSAGDAKHLISLGVLAEHDPSRFKATNSTNLGDSVDQRCVEVDGLIAAEDERLSRALEDLQAQHANAVVTAQQTADAEIAKIDATLSKARDDADAKIKEIDDMVTKARTDAETETAKLKQDVEQAKAEAKAANKAEKVPQNKAD